ncbi:MAG: hypothetical protein J6X51_04470 [Bacteroidales bacterium]|nr:hypothetical protein [Bacteroidales bacterium]
MSRAIDKRNRQNPFDYQFAENFSLDGVEDPLINNSYYFSAHDEKKSFFARLGKRVNADETWFVIYLDDNVYSLKQQFFPQGQSPVKVEKDGENWAVSYQGVLNDNDEITFQATFIAKHNPIDFTSDMPAERMATGIANEKWNKAFFEQLQNVSGQCHYEQEGVLEGQLTLNGKTVDFQLPCVRDHSFGKRDWNYMNNHLWLMAVSSDRQFNYSLVSYPVMSVLEVGHFRDDAGMHCMWQADLDFHKINKGTVPQELSLNMTLDDGKTIPVRAKVLAGVTYHFQDGQYILHENIAEFTIDGKTGRGILEIGFNHDNNRFFNQRELSSIRR